MVKLLRSTVVDAPINDVWRFLRDFNGHDRWHPAVDVSTIEDGETSDTVGAIRAFRLTDGSGLREQLIALSDRDFSLTYSIVEAPLPLDDYVATMSLKPVTDGDRTCIFWTSQFHPPAASAERLTRMVATDIYEVGLKALQRHFARGRAAVPLATPTIMARDGGFRPALPATPVRLAAARAGEANAAGETDAIVVETYGAPGVMRLERVAVPRPGPGAVRIRHEAIGVNMIDAHCRAGLAQMMPLPGVPGMEAAGVVVETGPGVAHLAAGDRVVYACAPTGAYAAERTMPAELVVRLPRDMDAQMAAGVFLKGLMATVLALEVRPLRSGENVLIHSAAGGVGLLLCQLAHAAGATVIAAVSTPGKAEAALEAGASAVSIHGRDDLQTIVMGVTRGRGADAVFDPIGAATYEISLAALAVTGHLVSFGQAGGRLGQRDLSGLAAKSGTLSRPNVAHFTDTRERLLPRAGRLFDLIRSGELVPLPPARLPLGEAAEAHRRLEARETTGATILLP